MSDNDRVDLRCARNLLKVGYPAKLVYGYKGDALMMEREELLNPARNDQTKSERIPFVSIFSPQSGRVSNIVRKHWSLL